MYSDASGESSAAPDAKPKEDEGGETALVPKSLCPGMEPGEEMVVKIKRVLDDQYEVEYAPEPDKEKAPAPDEAPAPKSGDGEMSSMMADY